MSDRATNVRPGRSHRRPVAGLVHDGGAWVDPLEVRRFDPPRPRIRSAVPEGETTERPDDWRGTVLAFTEAPEDGLGGYLRAEPQAAGERVADDAVLLAGHPLYVSVDGRFEVRPDEDEAQARRRRRDYARWALEHSDDDDEIAAARALLDADLARR